MPTEHGVLVRGPGGPDERDAIGTLAGGKAAAPSLEQAPAPAPSRFGTLAETRDRPKHGALDVLGNPRHGQVPDTADSEQPLGGG